MLEETEQPFELTSERAIYQEYESQRRLRLITSAAPLLCMLAAFFAISMLVYALLTRSAETSALVIEAIIEAFTATGLGVATYYSQQARTQLASHIIIITLTVSIFAVVTSWNLLVGIDPFGITTMSFLGLGIATVGLLSGQRGALLTTIVSNITVIVLFAIKLPHAAPPFIAQATLYIPLLVFVQWAFAGLIIAILGNFQQTFRDISQVYAQIKQIDEIKDQFITSVNHELRNPIMAMSGYIEVLRLRQRQMDADRRAEILDQAGGVGERISGLLESILDARRLDQSADDFTPNAVNIRTLVEASALLVNPNEGNMAGRDLQVHAAPDLLVWGDEVRLQQVLTNLFSNACKYSAKGTRIEVTAQVIVDADPSLHNGMRNGASAHQAVEITLRDHGFGIPPAQIPLLFRRFVRLPRDLASTTIGNGLGLHLCKVFIEAMHGRIWVTSTGIDGEGSTFHIVLPLPPTEFTLAASNPGIVAQALH